MQAGERAHRIATAGVPQLRGSVLADRRVPRAVRGHRQIVDSLVIRHMNQLHRDRIHFDRLVRSRRDDRLVVRMKRRAADRADMMHEELQLPLRRQIPNTHRSVRAGADDLIDLAIEVHAGDLVRVPGERGDSGSVGKIEDSHLLVI